MLGDLIYEAKGKVTGIRVLDVEGGVPKVETTISQNGNLREGTDAANLCSLMVEIAPNLARSFPK